MAVADLPTFGMYSAGKVARDKYHTLLAKETPSVTTLNHEPDPLETDMATEIRNAESLDSNLKPNFEQQLLDPLDSARKLFRILDSNDFESGAHMDYYDLPDVEYTKETNKSSSKIYKLSKIRAACYERNRVLEREDATNRYEPQK
jgi:hypothetical protein